MREKLAMAFYESAGIKWENVPQDLRYMMMWKRIDAFLDALMEPSEAMVCEGDAEQNALSCTTEIWQAMLQAGSASV